jgi:hypothetical protein
MILAARVQARDLPHDLQAKPAWSVTASVRISAIKLTVAPR